MNSFDVMKFEIMAGQVLDVQITYRIHLNVHTDQYIVWKAEQNKLEVYTPNKFKREYEVLK